MVVGFDGFDPVVAGALRTILAETDVNQEVAVVVVGFEVGSGLVGGPLVDWASARFGTVPAS